MTGHELIKQAEETLLRVQSLRNKLEIGRRVRVLVKRGTKMTPRTELIGEIIYKNNHFIVVDAGRYKEAFTYMQILLGEARLTK